MKGLLLIVAHPDDEFFCAGALAAMCLNHIPVTVAYWTRGEGGYKSRFNFIYSLLPCLHPRVREVKNSLQGLGIPQWVFLDYTDPAPLPFLQAPQHEPENLKKELRGLIDRMHPELVLTHGSNGEYGHPAHLALHQAIRGILQDQEVAPGIITFASSQADPELNPLQNTDDRTDTVLDSLPYNVQKLGVLRAHRSQQSTWKRLFPENGGSLEKLVALTRFEHYHVAGHSLVRKRTLQTFNRWTGAQNCPQPTIG